MQVGDIVELSAYGKRLKCNEGFVARVGLVMEVEPVRGLASQTNAVMVNWSGLNNVNYHIRRDLKHAK
jgi:hypothetical protein